ncbi:MAG: methyltransferase domain-containing protein, partial [Proteobacteria bacterium]|nr:methyltransferase domain-containing protein [Pseudomonadota bacterium]
ILVVDALHHFRHPKESIRELLRVLKPGGRLVIDEFDASLLSVKLIALAEKLALMGSRFFKPEEIVAMIADCGFPAEVRENGKTSFWVVVEKGGI